MDDAPVPAAPRRGRRWLAAATVAPIAIAALVTGLVLGLVLGAGPRPAAHRARTLRPPVPVSRTVTLPPTPAPARSLAAAPRVPHQHVRPAAPVRFVISGPAFRIAANVCGMAAVFPLDPPGDQHHTVCWVDRGFGVEPGSDTATTYVLGHAWAEDAQEVLNKLSARAMSQVLREVAHHDVKIVDGVATRPITNLDGYRVALHTAAGTLRYEVRNAWAAPKAVAGDVRDVMDQRVAHRLVLITCGERDGVDYDYNIVVDAFLVSSVAAKA